MKLNATRILVTGAAGGIGRELSKLLSVRGARLCLVDREMTAVAALDDATRYTVCMGI